MIEGFEVTIDRVKGLMNEGNAPFFLNLRHHHDADLAVMKVRGAFSVPDDELERHLGEIPRERTVIVYSSCPGDEPSIGAARLLQQHGWNDVHPLAGGFNAYLEAGLPVEEVAKSTTKRVMML